MLNLLSPTGSDVLGHFESRLGLATVWLRAVCDASPLAGFRVTFYLLCKRACSRACKSGAPIDDIKFFGAWRNRAMLRYLNEAPARSRVASFLAN